MNESDTHSAVHMFHAVGVVGGVEVGEGVTLKKDIISFCAAFVAYFMQNKSEFIVQ